MNARLWACVIAGVLLAHFAVIHIIDQWRMLGKPLPKPNDPTFTTSTITYVDSEGRRVKVVREYTVSTRFADEATLRTMPPAPGQDASVR
jgi:hypothetical protein